MQTRIYFYTGTGNSLWTARRLAHELDGEIGGEMGGAELIPMGAGPEVTEKAGPDGADAIGLVFPVHIWGLPRRVVEFVAVSISDPARYYFALAVDASQVSSTLLQLKKMLERKGAVLSAGYEIQLPSNYIPWGGPGPETEQRRKFAGAAEKIKRIAPVIQGRKQSPIERGPLWQRIFFSAIYRLTFARVPGMDKDFYTDTKCNGCGICEKVCTGANVRLENGRPVWLNRCEQCLACLQWCPQEAVQFGKKTPRYPRYHHPEITLKDILTMAAALSSRSRKHMP